MFVEYGVVDDYGDNWETGYIIHREKTLRQVKAWAENENYHSASIVKITDGKREKVA